MPTDLVLVRHGESESNAARRRLAAGDPRAWRTIASRHTSRYRLTERGAAQADLAGAWIRENLPDGFDACLCSEYARAMETASRLGIPGARWILDPSLHEADTGVVDERREATRGRVAEEEDEDDDEPLPPLPRGKESVPASFARFDAFLGRLSAQLAGRRVLLVLHRHVMVGLRIMIERIPRMWVQDAFLERLEEQASNAAVVHYTRRDPSTGDMRPHVGWVRMFRPCDGGEQPEWTAIHRPTFVAGDLAAMVESIPRLVSSTRGEMRGCAKPV